MSRAVTNRLPCICQQPGVENKNLKLEWSLRKTTLQVIYKKFLKETPISTKITFTSKDRLTETRLYKQPAIGTRSQVLITLASLNTNTENVQFYHNTGSSSWGNKAWNHGVTATLRSCPKRCKKYFGYTCRILLLAEGSNSAEPGVELPLSPRDCLPVGVDFAQDSTPLRSKAWPLYLVSAKDPSPVESAAGADGHTRA